MGKPKNKSKGKDVDYDSEPDAVEEMEEKDSKPAAKASKKAKKKNKKDDDWEDDIAAELESLSMEVNKGNKEKKVEEEETPAPVKKEKKKKKKKQDSDDEEMDEDVPAVNLGKKKAAFNMLMMEDEEEEEKDKSEGSEEEVVKVEKPVKQQKKKENKKKGKEKTAEEEDLDALLAEIDKPTEKTSKKSKKDKKKEALAEAEENGTEEKEPTPEVQKVEPKIVTIDDLDDDEDDKKKKKKKGKEKKDNAEEGDKEGDKEGEDEDGGTVKTAAQKKKEKKERERLKKLAEKKKQGQKDTLKPAEQKVPAEPTDQESGAPDTAEQSTIEAAEDKDEKAGSGNEDEGEAEGKKKKKKKKGEKEEAEKKKRKAPVAAIKEMLQRQKEEEERLKREEEERIQKEEEAHQAYLEKKRIEEEKKAKKREKEKERKARLKAEGKWTAQQKQERLRAQQLLEAQGLDLPKKEEQEETEEKKKKRPIYVDKKKIKKKMQVDDAQPGETPSPEETPTQTPAETPVTEELPSESPLTPEVEEKKEPKDDWMESSEEEDEDEEDEKESSPEQEETTKIEIKDKADAEEGSDEEDEDDDEEEDEDEDDEEEEEEESSDDDDLTAYDRAEKKIQKFHAKCEAARSTDNLRAPVVVVLGHVDTGKTKILDKLRRTNVQDGEAGGITQQIGATNVPKYAILEKTTMCKEFQKKELKLPGLLIIDTPGHESFSNLRSRGSSLCDIAILVIDIMHGLEPQTIESINLLKDRKTPFVVALNKVDRLYQWKSNPNNDVANTIKKQGPMAKTEFDERARKAIVELAEQGLNAALFYENKNPKEYISLVPTSAHSGDGMGNLVALICELTQTWLAKKVSYSEELQATVMEVKSLPGLGTTIDVILVNGTLREGDQIVIAGTEGPIVTQIRGLLMPQPMKEFRVKGTYDHYKEVKAAQGVKVIGKDMEKALAGLPLYVASNDDEVEYYKQELSDALKDVLNSIKCVERGVFVQASTLGSLEALLEFLRTSEIPYAGINIGPVHKKDIMRASVMLEHDSQWAVILAFDVKVERDAQEMADNLGVRIFTADIIYHLEDKFLKFREDLKKQKQEEFKHIAVFPCKLRVLPQYIFNSRDPIVMGVVVEAGVVKMGTPICVPSKEFVFLGQITSIEVNHKQQDTARKGQEVCIKIENVPGETPKLYGRHFDHTDMLVSRVSRASIDAVKNHFREEMTKPDWALMVELKKLFQIL